MSLSPSDVTISFIFISVVVAFTLSFAFNVSFTTSSGVLLPTFLIATNSPVSLLYFNSSQSFWHTKSFSVTSSNICLSYYKVALYAFIPFLIC